MSHEVAASAGSRPENTPEQKVRASRSGAIAANGGSRGVVNNRLRDSQKAVRKATGRFYWSVLRVIVIEDSVLVRMQRMSRRR